MRHHFIAASFAMLFIASPALAQSYGRGAATTSFVQTCVASPQMRHAQVPEPSCACSAGILSARMSDRQYEIVRRLAPHTGNDTAMSGEIRQMMNEGYTAQEIGQVGQTMIDLGPLIDQTCAALER